jgi:mevalonate kinase
MTVTARTSAELPSRALRLDIPALGILRTIPTLNGDVAVKEPGDLAVLAVAIAAAGIEPPAGGLHVRIESAIPSGAGFGSSAALSVAVVAGCRRACGDDVSRDEIARLASSIERHQHERASGVDVQAVLRGGVLSCRRPAGGELVCEELSVTESGLLEFRLFHSGAPHETTGEMVAAVRRLLDREPARVRDAFAAIDATTEDGRKALLSGDGDALVPIVRRAEAALETIGVVPEAVRDAIRAIEAQGGAAKISGAGGSTGAGGGLVLVVHPDPSWHARFVPAPGWAAHRVRLGAPGLRSEKAA